MRQVKRGFTIMELLTVFAIVGILAMFAYPKFVSAVEKASLRSAKTQVAAALTRTRAAAIQRGRQARLVVTGNNVQILVDSGTLRVPMGGAVDLMREHKVSITSATRDTIPYDPRGMAVGLSNVEKIFLGRGTYRDSVCVSRLGRIGVRDCTV